MKTAYRAKLASTLLPLLLLTACSEEAPLPPPESRPVKTMLVGGVTAGNFRQFPGVVDAIQRADLSFRVQGKIIEVLVREGDLVEKGKVLAKLDPTDYQIVLNDRKASYATASANFERAAPTSLPYGSPHHSPLPTGRPDSPSGLDRTKSDVPVGFSLPKSNGSANFTGRGSPPVKLAEDSFTGRVD